jgi:hypothetical protein
MISAASFAPMSAAWPHFAPGGQLFDHLIV